MNQREQSVEVEPAVP